MLLKIEIVRVLKLISDSVTKSVSFFYRGCKQVTVHSTQKLHTEYSLASTYVNVYFQK